MQNIITYCPSPPHFVLLYNLLKSTPNSHNPQSGTLEVSFHLRDYLKLSNEAIAWPSDHPSQSLAGPSTPLDPSVESPEKDQYQGLPAFDSTNPRHRHTRYNVEIEEKLGGFAFREDLPSSFFFRDKKEGQG